MAVISKIWAREILDSRGIPTVEVACQLDTGHIAVSSVPSGTSTGMYEALELRDDDPKRFKGKGVLKAVNNVNTVLAKAVVGKDPTKQAEIDKIMIELDGTKNKSRLGANAILAVSMVICKASALFKRQTLFSWISNLAHNQGIEVVYKMPTPLFNMINGGLHGAGNLDIQEFHVIPVSIKKYKESLQMCEEIYMTVGESLQRKGAIHSVGDEGGYAPNLFTNRDALQLLVESIQEAGYKLGRDVLLGLDVAADTLYKNGAYIIKDRTTPLSDRALTNYFKDINDEFHLAVLEDPLHEDAWEDWERLTKMLGKDLIVVGDDLLATNPIRVAKAIKEKACNGILVKPNQIGTITETLEVIKMARDAKWKVIVSHRSGETNDWFIADLAVGVGADFVKFGAPARGERVAKYNRLLSIEQEIS